MECLLSESCCASPPPTFHHLSEGYQERFCTPFQGRDVPSFLSKRFIHLTNVEQMVKIVCLCQQTSLSLVLFICRMEILPLLCSLWDAPAHTRLALTDWGIVTRAAHSSGRCPGGRSSQCGARGSDSKVTS